MEACDQAHPALQASRFSTLDSLNKYHDCTGDVIQFENDSILMLKGDKEFEDLAVVIYPNKESVECSIERYEFQKSSWVLKETISSRLGYGIHLKNVDINADGVTDFLVGYRVGISGNAMQIPFLQSAEGRCFSYQSSFNVPNLVYISMLDQFWSASFNGGPCNANSYSQFKLVGNSLERVWSYKVEVDCITGHAVIKGIKADSSSVVFYEGFAGNKYDSVLNELIPKNKFW